MFYIDGVQDDSIAVSVPSNGSAVTVDIGIDCFDGHEVSLDAVTSLSTVEMKHSTDVSWTDLEAGNYDVSSFASEAQPVTFQFRFDPSTAGTDALRFRVGPLVPVISYTYVYNDDGDEIFNDDSELVRTIE